MAMAVSVRTESGERGTVVGAASFEPGARFLIYSVTKTLIATAMLRLVDAGELMLDQPVARWLPAAPESGRMTLRQLLQHTSGLRDYGILREYHEAVERGDEPWCDEELCRRARAAELLFEPGAGWSYSNIGYLLLRRLLERVHDQPLDAVLRSEIFGPLGLTEPFVATERSQLAAITFGKVEIFGGRSVRTGYHPGWVAHGVVAATAAEVSTMFRALFVGELLPRAMLGEMLRMVPIPIDERDRARVNGQPRYGLGVMQMGDEVTALGHSGGGPGSTAAAYHCGKITACALSDTDDLAAERWAICAVTGDLGASR